MGKVTRVRRSGRVSESQEVHCEQNDLCLQEDQILILALCLQLLNMSAACRWEEESSQSDDSCLEDD